MTTHLAVFFLAASLAFSSALGGPLEGRVYWTDVAGPSGGHVLRRNSLEDTPQVVIGGLRDPRGLAVDVAGGKLYWAEPGSKCIKRCNLDGSDVRTLITSSDAAAGMALDLPAQKLYWTDGVPGNGSIKRSNLDGTGVETIVTGGLHLAVGLAVDSVHGKVYWTDVQSGGTGTIQRANLDGTHIETILTGIDEANGLALDVSGGVMYWPELVTNRIQCAHLDGSDVRDVIAGINDPTNVALDLVERKIYWTDSQNPTATNTNRIERADLDGTGREVVISGIGQPWGVAIAVTTPPSKKRLAPPTPKVQEDILRIIRDLYESDFEEAQSADGKVRLAEKLMRIGHETPDDDDIRFVLWKTAWKAAADSGRIETACKAVECASREFEINRSAILCEVVETSCRSIVKGSEQDAILLIQTLYGDAIETDQFDVAQKLAASELAMARRAKNVSAFKEASERARSLEKQAAEYMAVKEAMAILDSDPTDRDANLSVGRYLCFYKGKWEKGVRLLALGSDPVLKSLANKELKAKQPSDRVSLADAWVKYATEVDKSQLRNVQSHAKELYLKALPGLSPLASMKVRKILEELQRKNAVDAKLPSGTAVAFSFDKDTFHQRSNRKLYRDLSDHGGDAELLGGRFVSGIRGTAVEFRGTGWAKFPDGALPVGNAARSVLFWTRIDLANRAALFSYGSANNGDATYFVVMDEADSQGRGLKLSVGNPGGQGEPCGKAVVADGKWHHVALVYDGAGTVRSYVDGQLDLTFSRQYQTSKTGSAFVGSFIEGASMTGAIDEFIVLDRPLEESEIRKIKDLGLYID